MAAARGKNEGFSFLEEFDGRAIVEPGLLPPGTTFARGINAGMQFPDEIVIDASKGTAGPPPAPALLEGLSGPQRAALRIIVADGSLDAVAGTLGLTPPQARELILDAVNVVRTRLIAG
jgi:hypothetical protein